jgi:hypothetical protein
MVRVIVVLFYEGNHGTPFDSYQQPINHWNNTKESYLNNYAPGAYQRPSLSWYQPETYSRKHIRQVHDRVSTGTDEHGPYAKSRRRIILVEPSYYSLWQSGLQGFAVHAI